MKIWHFTRALSLMACLPAHVAALGGEDATPIFRHCGVKDGEPHCAQGISAQAMGGPPPILRQPSPVYPPSLTGVGGEAHVRFTITEDGRTTDVKAVSVEPEGTAFGEAAVRAVRRYLFEQPKIDGQPVAVHEVGIKVVFEAEVR